MRARQLYVPPMQVRTQPEFLIDDAARAAGALRKASERYRQALMNGDLIGAIDAREREIEARVRLDRARMLIEGSD